jgi:hypothetical protein
MERHRDGKLGSSQQRRRIKKGQYCQAARRHED